MVPSGNGTEGFKLLSLYSIKLAKRTSLRAAICSKVNPPYERTYLTLFNEPIAGKFGVPPLVFTPALLG